jgi:hypothetical protein
LDIEGSEHRVIESFLDSGIRPRVVCIEFDQPVRMRTLMQSIRSLQQSKYQLAKIDVWNYTFLYTTEKTGEADNS